MRSKPKKAFTKSKLYWVSDAFVRSYLKIEWRSKERANWYTSLQTDVKELLAVSYSVLNKSGSTVRNNTLRSDPGLISLHKPVKQKSFKLHYCNIENSSTMPLCITMCNVWMRLKYLQKKRKIQQRKSEGPLNRITIKGVLIHKIHYNQDCYYNSALKCLSWA